MRSISKLIEEQSKKRRTVHEQQTSIEQPIFKSTFYESSAFQLTEVDISTKTISEKLDLINTNLKIQKIPKKYNSNTFAAKLNSRAKATSQSHQIGHRRKPASSKQIKIKPPLQPPPNIDKIFKKPRKKVPPLSSIGTNSKKYSATNLSNTVSRKTSVNKETSISNNMVPKDLSTKLNFIKNHKPKYAYPSSESRFGSTSQNNTQNNVIRFQKIQQILPPTPKSPIRKRLPHVGKQVIYINAGRPKITIKKIEREVSNNKTRKVSVSPIPATSYQSNYSRNLSIISKTTNNASVNNNEYFSSQAYQSKPPILNQASTYSHVFPLKPGVLTRSKRSITSTSKNPSALSDSLKNGFLYDSTLYQSKTRPVVAKKSAPVHVSSNYMTFQVQTKGKESRTPLQITSRPRHHSEFQKGVYLTPGKVGHSRGKFVPAKNQEKGLYSKKLKDFNHEENAFVLKMRAYDMGNLITASDAKQTNSKMEDPSMQRYTMPHQKKSEISSFEKKLKYLPKKSYPSKFEENRKE